MPKKLLLPRLSPIQIIGAGSFTGLLFIIIVATFALQQPWLGIHVKYQAGQSSLKVIGIIEDSPADNKLFPGDEILSFEYGNKTIDVSPLHNIEDPDSNPTYALYNQFMQKQSELHNLLLHEKVIINLKNKSVTLHPQATRPLSSLPFDSYWMVTLFGFLALVIILSIWSYQRGKYHIRILAILGAGFFVGAIFNAVTLSREIALSGELFHIFSSLNLMGILLFSFSITALLWNYPKKLSDFPSTAIIYFLYPVIWINQTWQLVELPLHAYYLQFLVTFIFMIIFALRQWMQSRNSIADQAAIHWLLLSITISLGITFALFYVPTVYSSQAYIPVSGAYIAGFMVFLGIIMGIIKYRLFNLSRIWMEIWVWIIGGILLLLIDIFLVYVLKTASGLALIISALIVGWVYFPTRYWFSSKILKLQPRSVEHYFPLLIQKLIDVRSHKSINEKWHDILRDIFLPLEIAYSNEPLSKISISDNGINLLVPSLDNKSTLRLQYQANGKKLYSKSDIKLCNSLYEITQYTANIKHAHEEGIKIERQRIARDLDDGIVKHLLALIKNSDEAEIVTKANDILSSLRETINSLDLGSTINIQIVITNIISIITERIELAGLKLNIETKISAKESALSPRQSINLQRIIQEIISNIIKHAAASQITVFIYSSQNELRIEIGRAHV